MHRHVKKLGIILVCLLAFQQHAMAASEQQRALSFQKGVDAYEMGQYREALDDWLPLARDGDMTSARNVAHLYENGLGVPKDLAESLRWYEKASEGGILVAQYRAGMMYLQGEGTLQNLAKAATYLTKAAQGGYPPAQYNLGVMYEKGIGVPKDNEQAMSWFYNAATAGHDKAIAKMGKMVKNADVSANIGAVDPKDVLKDVGKISTDPFKSEKSENISIEQDDSQPADEPSQGVGLKAPEKASVVTDKPVPEQKKPEEPLQKPVSEKAPQFNEPVKKEADLKSKPDEKPKDKPAQSELGVDADMSKFIENTKDTQTPQAETDKNQPSENEKGLAIPHPASAVDKSAQTEQPSGESIKELQAKPAYEKQFEEREKHDKTVIIVDKDLQKGGNPYFFGMEEQVKRTTLPEEAEKGVDTSLQRANPRNAKVGNPFDPVYASQKQASISGESNALVSEEDQMKDAPASASVTPEKKAVEEGKPAQAPSGLSIRDFVNETENGNSKSQPADKSVGEQKKPAEPAQPLPKVETPKSEVPSSKNEAMNFEKIFGIGQDTSVKDSLKDEKPLASKQEKTAKPTEKSPEPVKPEPAKKDASVEDDDIPVVQSNEPAQKGKQTVETKEQKSSAITDPEKAYAKGDYKTAFDIWSKRAEKNDAEAYFWLGRLYNSGKGIQQDTKMAYKYWSKATKKGHSRAETALANLQSRLSDKEMYEIETEIGQGK